MNDTELQRLPVDIAVMIGWYAIDISAMDGRRCVAWYADVSGVNVSQDHPTMHSPWLFGAALDWCVEHTDVSMERHVAWDEWTACVDARAIHHPDRHTALYLALREVMG